jgi:long-chain acyl-CoA synthetase
MSRKPWLSHYQDIPETINPDAYPSVVAMMDEAIGKYPDRIAFHCMGQQISYSDLSQRAYALSAYLQQRLGVKKGDRVAVMLPNIIAFPMVCLAIARAGAVQVNVNPMYTPRELEHQLNDSGAQTIVVIDAALPTMLQILDKSPLKTVISASALAGGKAMADARIAIQGAITLDAALREGSGMRHQRQELSGDDLLFLQYTGGTTGLSKGAALTHRNLVANIEQFKAFMPSFVRPAQEVVVTAIPMYHIFALMVNFLSYFTVGAENWLVPNPRDMDAFIDLFKSARPTVFTGVNTLFGSLIAHPRSREIDFSRLQFTAGGGAAVLAATSAHWQQLTGNFIREGYGLSETSPVLSFNPANAPAFTGTTGFPLPSTDIKLIDDDGQETPPGVPGEVCAKGPQVMSGYWQQPQANATSFTEDGYFRTGDIGVFDAQGMLKIVDRKKDMILVSGFNVFPNEIEAVAASCPGVLECACVGVPDEKTGEAARLYVVAVANSGLDPSAISAFCRSELTSYKVPKQVVMVDTLPKSTVGKILRRELRDLH